MEQFVGQTGEFSSAVGFLEALHQGHDKRRRRGEPQQLGADQEVGPASFGGEAAHQARQQMLLHQRTLPQGAVAEQADDGVTVKAHMGFQGEPEQQRNIGVLRILVPHGERRDQREHLAGRQTTGRRRELGTDLGIGLRESAREHRGEDIGGQVASPLGTDTGDAEATIHAILVAQETRGPETNRSVGMGQRSDGTRIGERVGLIERPERAEGSPTLVGREQRVEQRERRRIATFSQQLQRGRAVELIRVTEQGYELGGRLAFEIRIGLELGILVAEAVEAARRGIDLVLVVLTVRDVIFIHVGHEERAVGGVGAVERPEPHVLGPHGDALVGRHIRRALRDALGVGDGIVERIEGEQVALIFRRHGRTFDEGPEVGEARDLGERAEDRELAEGVGRPRRAELAGVDALLEIDAALDVVPAAGIAAVVAGIHPAVAVELEPEGIARALAEDVILARLRVVAPNHAAFEMDRSGVGGIEARTHDA